MPRYPGALWKPWPENATQPRGVKTQVIVHSTADSRGALSTWEYFNRPDITVESTVIVGFKGDALQGLDSSCRADANYTANWRAIAVETVGAADQPWTDAQIAWLVDFFRWCNVTHGVPLVVAPAHDQPGLGYHRMYPEWSPGPTACPNDLRVQQFHDVLMPTLLSGGDMPLTDADIARLQQLLVDVSVKQGYAGVAGACAAALRSEGVSGVGDAVRKLLDRPAGNLDPAAVAQAIADRLGPDLAGAVAAELARRLAA